MPATQGETLPTEALGKLGDLLSELTGGEPASTVHAAIVERAGDPSADARLAGVAGLDSFSDAWAALRAGSPPDGDAWQGVVLPTVLAFSNPQALKTQLGLATSLWLGWARTADSPAVTVTEEIAAAPENPATPDPAPAGDAAATQPPAVKRRAHRVLVVGTVLVLLAVAALVWAAHTEPPIAGYLPWAMPRPPAAEAGQQAETVP